MQKDSLRLAIHAIEHGKIKHGIRMIKNICHLDTLE